MAQRRRHCGTFKTRVAVEAIARYRTTNAIAGAYDIHPSEVAKWKVEALKRLPEVLSDGRKGKAEGSCEAEAGLYQQIGRLTMEAEYFKGFNKTVECIANRSGGIRWSGMPDGYHPAFHSAPAGVAY